MAEFNTEKYEATWRRKPRGHGLWWFRIGKREEAFTGKYSELIKNAKASARILGETEVVVLP